MAGYAELSIIQGLDNVNVKTGLSPATTYFYQAYATVRGTEDHASETATFYGDVKSFITSSGAVITASYSGANAQPQETRIVYGTSVAEQNSNWNTFKKF